VPFFLPAKEKFGKKNFAWHANPIIKNRVINNQLSEYKIFLAQEAKKYNNSPKVHKILIAITFLISFGLHLTFLADNLYGWTEKEYGIGFSALGCYHIFVFVIFLFILADFAVSSMGKHQVYLYK